MKTLYIEPGSSWENGYAESFIGCVGDELLKREVFTLIGAKVLVEEYREHHNHRWPHSSLGFLTPADFAARDEPSGTDEDLIKELELVMALL